MKILEHFIKRKQNNQGCCHDLSSESNTLIKSPKRTMVYPDTQDYMCIVCKQTFTIQRNGAVYNIVNQ